MFEFIEFIAFFSLKNGAITGIQWFLPRSSAPKNFPVVGSLGFDAFWRRGNVTQLWWEKWRFVKQHLQVAVKKRIQLGVQGGEIPKFFPKPRHPKTTNSPFSVIQGCGFIWWFLQPKNWSNHNQLTWGPPVPCRKEGFIPCVRDWRSSTAANNWWPMAGWVQIPVADPGCRRTSWKTVI